MTIRIRIPLPSAALAAAALAAAALAVTTTAGTAAAAEIVTIATSRGGTDLTLQWSATPTATSYRVYRSHSIDCQPAEMVYDGLNPWYTEPGAFADPLPALYRITALEGTLEGPPSEPVYRYPIALASGESRWLAFPFHVDLADSLALCDDLNTNTAAVESISWVDPATGLFQSQACAQPVARFPLVAGSSYLVATTPSGAGQVVAWGHGQPLATFDFAVAVVPPRPGIGAYAVSLPYDHAYADLQAIVGEIPEAVGVQVWDPAIPGFAGLTRTDIASAWTGTNALLDGDHTVGLLVEVASPSRWTPRRRCSSVCIDLPARIGDLVATHEGPHVDLIWTPQMAARDGYGVFRVADPAAIPMVLAAMPWLRVPSPAPTFPVRDANASPPPGTAYYYQVAGTCAGSWGAL